MATIVGQEAKAEGTRMAKIMSDLEKRMESCEGKVSQARGPDAETQALTSRLKRDIEALMEMNDNTRDANQKLEAQLIDVQQTNLFLRTEVEDLKERLVASEDQSSVR